MCSLLEHFSKHGNRLLGFILEMFFVLLSLFCSYFKTHFGLRLLFSLLPRICSKCLIYCMAYRRVSTLLIRFSLLSIGRCSFNRMYPSLTHRIRSRSLSLRLLKHAESTRPKPKGVGRGMMQYGEKGSFWALVILSLTRYPDWLCWCSLMICCFISLDDSTFLWEAVDHLKTFMWSWFILKDNKKRGAIVIHGVMIVI